jgi:DNA-binding transcriptional regulator GbsR (MarR family)
MDGPLALSPDIQRFIEAFGGYFTQYGLPRIAGRLLGLVLVVEGPLTLDDMAAALDVSRASISTNVRLLESIGFMERVTVPRDRRDYYRCSADPWEARMRSSLIQLDVLRAIARRGLTATTGQDTYARARLEELTELCDFLLEEEVGMLQRWRTYRERRARERRDQGATSQ